MIKNFTPSPFDGNNPLPTYVTGIRIFTLSARTPGGYFITLGRLTVGNSVSAGKDLTHSLYESYTDHGERVKVARTRASDYDREFISAISAMRECGVEILPSAPCPCENIMKSLGDWYKVNNPEIEEVLVVSQKCH